MTNAASVHYPSGHIDQPGVGECEGWERGKERERERRRGSEGRGVREGSESRDSRGRVKEGEEGKERDIERGENWCN